MYTFENNKSDIQIANDLSYLRSQLPDLLKNFVKYDNHRIPVFVESTPAWLKNFMLNNTTIDKALDSLEEQVVNRLKYANSAEVNQRIEGLQNLTTKIQKYTTPKSQTPSLTNTIDSL